MYTITSCSSLSEIIMAYKLELKSELSSSGPNVKVKSKLGPEIGFVMG